MSDEAQWPTPEDVDAACDLERRASEMGMPIVHVARTERGHVWRVELGLYVESVHPINPSDDAMIDGWRRWLISELDKKIALLRGNNGVNA